MKPARRKVAMARRSLSALEGLKPAQSIAICIACSWNSGTPLVRLRMFLSLSLRSLGKAISSSARSRFFR